MRIYIERNGRAYNYLPSVNALNAKREDHLTVEEEEAKEAKRKREGKEFSNEE